MGSAVEQKPGASSLTQRAPQAHVSAVGKQPLVPAVPPAATQPGADVVPPRAAINKVGFVDNSKGAPLYTKPAEAGGVLVGAVELAPAARVFVSGVDQHRERWVYVTAYIDGAMVRGYVEDFRINTDLPEPLAELRQLDGGETPEGLAVEKFADAVTDGHDLRFYENVLLYVNRGRKGIQGTYQDPGIVRRGNNNIRLYSGHRIWLVSAAYAKALEGVVPSGSLTGGAVAKARRFASHVEDILHSVTESPEHFEGVAGELAQSIRDHMPAIVGITAGFLMAEAGSMLLAATPTGVGQALAAITQLVLSAMGAAGMVEAGIEALKHGTAWLTTAWTAHGRADIVSEASREFVRMLVAIALAALNRAGAKANYRNALRLANQMPTGGLPAVAAIVGHGGAPASAGVALAGGPGAAGLAGAAALRLSDGEKAALGDGPDVDGLTERKTKEARSGELHDRRAADGRRATAPESEAKTKQGPKGQKRAFKAPVRPRTELARAVPPPGEAFIEWFDSLTLRELDELLADVGTKDAIGAAEIITDNIRHPGSMHEWLMVAEVRQVKKWGVSMRTVLEGRTATLATVGKRFRHGAKGAGKMHEVLREMTCESETFGQFLQRLNNWADKELVPSHSTRWPHEAPQGRYSLPVNLQLRGHS